MILWLILFVISIHCGFVLGNKWDCPCWCWNEKKPKSKIWMAISLIVILGIATVAMNYEKVSDVCGCSEKK